MNKIETLKETVARCEREVPGVWFDDGEYTDSGGKMGAVRNAKHRSMLMDSYEMRAFAIEAHNLMPTLLEAVDALEAMRCSGGSVEFQANFDWAKSVLEKLK